MIHATPEIEAMYEGQVWTDLDSKMLSTVVRECIYEHKVNIRCDTAHSHGPATSWYMGAGFAETALTKSRVGGCPKDQAGLALVVWWRINAFPTVPMLVE